MSVAIKDNQVHVWQVNLKTIPADATKFTGTLSPDELERQENLSFSETGNILFSLTLNCA